MSHQCPVKGCTTSVGDHKLLCSSHWFTLHTGTRARVYKAWAGGLGKGTNEHRDAMQAAIAEADAFAAKQANAFAAREEIVIGQNGLSAQTDYNLSAQTD